MPEMTQSLSAAERARYAECKALVSANLDTCFKVGAALMEIRDSKLYREDFPTFSEFCQAEYGFARAQAYRLIQASEVMESLSQKEMSPIGDKIQAESVPITNESQARELAKVPEEKRPEVLQAAAATGAVTAASIAQAAKAESSPAQPPAPVLDKTGFVIPHKAMALWKRSGEVQKLLTAISTVRSALRAAQEENDVLWQPVSGPDKQQSWTTLITSLDKAYAQIELAMPYSVCPGCQGQVADRGCSWCNGRTMVSEFWYKHCFDSKNRAIRETQCKKT